MQTKLTLRIEEGIVRKAKRMAKQRGSSVSKMFSDFVSSNPDIPPKQAAPPITASMTGVLQGGKNIQLILSQIIRSTLGENSFEGFEPSELD